MAIKINPAHKGLFTAKAKAAGMSVQAFASKVLANPKSYSTVTVRQANFAHNAKGFNHNKKAVKRAGAMMRKQTGMKG